ncbi:hypothetical protein [Spiroplasma endosymbiont of Diplazon laetatorius]|uniref:hypothetical protein n=1 Tax=Spiroplasma endosymbiont of Diplazon laetatorius TaxID=3066322 RepID=UPI0030D08416
MTESLKYVNKSISGFYVQIENTHFGYKIYYGIFDTWRNAPIETNCEPWVEYVSWDDRQVNETVNRISYAFPYYDRYGNFNDIKYGFEFFSLPVAHIYYYFHQADYHDSLFLYWKEDIFSTWDFDLNKEVWFKNEHLNVRKGRYNQVDISTDYSIAVGEDTIKIATKIKAKGFAAKNPDYGVQINYGDYFTLFNSKSDIEVMRDFENRTKLLPPRLENRVLSMMDFTFSTVNDWWLILNLNHEFLNTLWAHFGLNMGFSEREILFSVFSSLFNEFNILSNEQKEILINGIQEAIKRQFHDAGLHGLVDNYHPANGNTVYGVWMFVSTNSISGWYSSITPWDHLQEPDQ